MGPWVGRGVRGKKILAVFRKILLGVVWGGEYFINFPPGRIVFRLGRGDLPPSPHGQVHIAQTDCSRIFCTGKAGRETSYRPLTRVRTVHQCSGNGWNGSYLYVILRQSGRTHFFSSALFLLRSISHTVNCHGTLTTWNANFPASIFAPIEKGTEYFTPTAITWLV